MYDPTVQQMIIAQSEMQRFHETEIRRREANVRALMQKISEMTQEDQGSTMRIEELERQRSMLRSAMAHMNQVHQASKTEHEVALMRIEEVSQSQHHELAESLSSQFRGWSPCAGSSRRLTLLIDAVDLLEDQRRFDSLGQ